MLTREDWYMPGKITKPNAEIWYMNRSGISNHFGAGVYGPRIDFRDSILMGSLFQSLACVRDQVSHPYTVQ
jgi:hypothetical protein